MLNIEQWVPGIRYGVWKACGKATTWVGATRIAKREYDPIGWGGFRHPDGGPKYGTLRAVDEDSGKVFVYVPSCNEFQELQDNNSGTK